MKRLLKLWRGELRLAEAFWLWGVAGTLGLAFGTQFLITKLILSGAIAGLVFVSLLLLAVGICYLVAVCVGIWRSAAGYSGLKLWRWSSRSVVVAVVAFNVYEIGAIALSLGEGTNDPGKSSANVEQFLQPSAEHPFVGFWKESCDHNFGLAIDAQDAEFYSLSFCGPGGCFKPGTYRPNTRLIDDPDYRVIDQNTIEVNGLDGFSRYIRCSPPPSVSGQKSQSNPSVKRDAALERVASYFKR